MAEYIYTPIQNVGYRDTVLFEGSCPCNRGAVIHQDGTGLFTLRGPSCPNQSGARYQMTFVGNIAVPTGGTVGEISVAIVRDGAILGQSLAASTPAAVEEFNNVTSTTYVTVPKGCCWTFSVQNTSDTAEAIEVRNANLVITRIA